jgi:hypothetical protein
VELNHIDNREYLPARARFLQGDHILEIEWLEHGLSERHIGLTAG